MRITRAPLLLAALALFFAAFLVVRFDDPGIPPAVPVVFLIALALPSYVAVVRWLGPARGIALLLLSLSIDRVYWYLPYVNTGFGGLVFLLAILRTVMW